MFIAISHDGGSVVLSPTGSITCSHSSTAYFVFDNPFSQVFGVSLLFQRNGREQNGKCFAGCYASPRVIPVLDHLAMGLLVIFASLPFHANRISITSVNNPRIVFSFKIFL